MTSLTKIIIKSAKGFGKSVPILFGVIFLIGLLNVLVPPEIYRSLFNQNAWLDSLLGAVLGSFMAGTPITSYVLGGELLNQGVSLVAITAFLVAWVTVGLVQLPAEAASLGLKFAVWRNATSFILAILVAMVSVFIMHLL